MSNLKSCPFCGGDAFTIGITQDRSHPIVRCPGCYAEACGEDGDESCTRITAVKAWNTRLATTEEIETMLHKADEKPGRIKNE